MADAGGGGGNTWEAFEVIIVILLAIGLLSQLSGKPIVPPGNSGDTIAQSDTTVPAQPACGLILSRPHSLESIDGFVTVAGRTEGCEWISTESVALYAQVVDARGKPISQYTTIAPTSFSTGVAAFNTTVAITATAAKGNGYLILISPSSSSTTYRIPLRFK